MKQQTKFQNLYQWIGQLGNRVNPQSLCYYPQYKKIAISIELVNLLVAARRAAPYLFFATIEVVGLLLIIWSAWKWGNPEGAT